MRQRRVSRIGDGPELVNKSADDKITIVSTFKVEIEVPSELRQFGFSEAEVRRDVPTLLVLKRFSEGAISSGKAAEMLSMTKFQFIDLLGREKIPIINFDDAEIEAELREIRRHNNRG
jgi:predicted HTH domain antitoxin